MDSQLMIWELNCNLIACLINKNIAYIVPLGTKKYEEIVTFKKDFNLSRHVQGRSHYIAYIMLLYYSKNNSTIISFFKK